MTSTGATRAEAPATSSRRRLLNVDVLLGNGLDSDDDEEGGTPLTPFVAATQSFDDANIRVPGRNDDKTNESGTDTQRPPNNLRSGPKTKLNKNRILDWFLGRHAHSTSEDLTNDSRPQGRDHIHGAVDDCLDIGDVQDICPACTTSYYQAVDSIPFLSSLKLIYNDTMSHKWLIGNKYVLHEALDDHPEDEYVPLVEASRALRTLAPRVPIPKVRTGWKENGKVITITDTVPGERLYDIWWSLSDAERENIAKQVALHIESWRKSDLGRISSLIGGPVYYHDNLFGTTEGGLGPFGSDLEHWRAIEQRLKKKGIDEDTIQLLKDHMPPSSPRVFTHGDLSSTNIIVHKGEVVAMTGFENAASLPAWAENVSMHFCHCAEDEQWKALLSKYTRSYRAASDWWSLWTAVEDAASADSAQLGNLKDRCRRWEKTEILGQPFWSIWLSHEDGASSRRLSIEHAEADEAEIHVGDLIRQAIVPDLLRRRYYQDSLSESSWGCSADDEGRGSADDDDDDNGQRPKKSVSSASGPPRQTIEALGREHKEPTPKPPSGKQRRRNSAPIAAIDSEVDPESGDKPTTTIQSRPQSRTKPDLSDGIGSETKGLRPLSLPLLTLSESTRDYEFRSAEKGAAEVVTGTATATATASTSREEAVAKRKTRPRSISAIPELEGEGDASGSGREESTNEEAGGESRRAEKRISSMLIKNNKKVAAAPGSLYAALSAASASASAGARPKKPRRHHERSKSEEQTRLKKANVQKTDGPGTSRPRPQSMLPLPLLQQPPTASSFRHVGLEGRGRVRDNDEKYGFR
ncbi:hypothetical protein F5B21DRAFT_522272 [Xylaria acuta]|nr:hypothetical protein F5B21DRAFT_522272 [Xylaria acuta]